MRLTWLIVAVSLVMVGCDGDDASPTQPSPTTTSVTLALGAQANALGLTVLVEQIADSRCPADALCVSPGEAIVTVHLSIGGVGSRYDLYANDASRRRVTYQRYEVELSTLQPYPLASRPTDPTAYRATLQVTSNAN